MGVLGEGGVVGYASETSHDQVGCPADLDTQIRAGYCSDC